VEAARAGEFGAGFAVVATEVRQLAQRSAVAARETTAKIEDATTKGARSAELAQRVGETLHQMVENTRKVDELVSSITDASIEQTTGLEQVVASMRRIDELTQSNAAAADETATAAHSLDDHARELRRELEGILSRRAVMSATDRQEPSAASADAEANSAEEPAVA
jgi:methyl-accepting chemotaxis protein